MDLLRKIRERAESTWLSLEASDDLETVATAGHVRGLTGSLGFNEGCATAMRSASRQTYRPGSPIIARVATEDAALNKSPSRPNRPHLSGPSVGVRRVLLILAPSKLHVPRNGHAEHVRDESEK